MLVRRFRVPAATAASCAILVAACASSDGAPRRRASIVSTMQTRVRGETNADPAPYDVTLFDDARITSHGGPTFHRVRADFTLDDGPKADVTLVVDLESKCYPIEDRDPPPPGHRWPANCDAFDRNFEITIIDPAAAPGTPPIEIVHAITPFGGPLHLEEDLTDLMNAITGKRTIEVFIPTYSDGSGRVTGSDGGWNVSATLQVTPGAPPRNVLAVLPLINTNLGSGSAPVESSFSLPAGTTSTRIEVRTSGHGGGARDADCIGPADEFCRRTHRIDLDGALLDERTPWRTDCADYCTLTHYGPTPGGFDYCLENPCGAIRSVRAPRANWCPGTETDPFTWTPPSLVGAGRHTLRYEIRKIGGGGSWRVSALAYAYGG